MSPGGDRITDGGAGRGRRVLIVDDHPLLGHALALQLRQAGHDAELAVLQERRNLLDDIVLRSPDLLILDLGLPIDGGGPSMVRPLVDAGIRIAVLTGESDRLLWARCLVDGAEVVLDKTEPLDDIIRAVETLLEGRNVRPHQRAELSNLLRCHDAEQAVRQAGFDRLSERERQVLAGLVAGSGTQDIARRDSVSVETVRSQIKSVLTKLGVNSQLAAVAKANDAGWSIDD